jgi:hypothetical protein
MPKHYSYSHIDEKNVSVCWLGPPSQGKTYAMIEFLKHTIDKNNKNVHVICYSYSMDSVKNKPYLDYLNTLKHFKLFNQMPKSILNHVINIVESEDVGLLDKL